MVSLYFSSPSKVTVIVLSPTGKSTGISPLPSITSTGTGLLPFTETYTVPFSPSPVTGSTNVTFTVVLPFTLLGTVAVMFDSFGNTLNAAML